jgi:alpha-1,2-mannosyltransferase
VEGPIRLRRFHWVVVLNFLLCVLALSALTSSLYDRHLVPVYCEGSVLDDTDDFFHGRHLDDSWTYMIAAVNQWKSHPGSSLYDAVFFREHVRFIYPLTSLVPLWAAIRAGVSEEKIRAVGTFLGSTSVVVTILCSLGIFLRLVEKQERTSVFQRAADFGAVLLLGFMFYPLMKGFSLGQLQVVIDALFALSLLCWAAERQRASGSFIGLICLMKPQFILIVLWGFLRKRWGFAWTAAGAIILGGSLAVAVFGFANNFEYFRVLSFLGRYGDAYYPNQSFNGLLNRLLQTGNSASWSGDVFPAYNSIVYFGTILTSAAILLLGVPWLREFHERRGMHEFCLIAVVATVCSPIAWEHHYGVFLPIFALLFAREGIGRPAGRLNFIVLVAAYALIANNLGILNVFSKPPLNILQSYALFGALLLIVLLRRLVVQGENVAVNEAAL